MVFSRSIQLAAACCLLAMAIVAQAVQSGYAPQANQYSLGGALAGDQVYPAASVKPSGGFVVWQDNRTDGDGFGVSALRLDSSFSALFSPFRVNENGQYDQSHPVVATLNNGGAAFAWLSGKLGMQHVAARFLSSSNTWTSGDIAVGSFTNEPQVGVVVAGLAGGQVVVAWGSFNQEGPGSMQGVYAQRFNSLGQKLGGEFLVNQTTAYNQRTPAVAALSDGRFVVVWVSEQQRFMNSVDVYARIYNTNGVAAGDEFLINAGTNVCANPVVAPSSDGGFLVAWSQKNTQIQTDSWDIFARPFSGSGFGGIERRVNTTTIGDQYIPEVSSIGSDYMVVWTSLGQDGSREGVYGQNLLADGSLAGGEYRVNTTVVSQQMQPALTSDGSGRYFAVWTSFVGGSSSFDLYSQRYVSTNQPLYAPAAPYVTVVTSNALTVSWPYIAGMNIANYEVYADGSATATAVVTNNVWVATGLAAASTHYYRLAYVLQDQRRSPLSAATTNSTYGGNWYYDTIPQEWMAKYFGSQFWNWPAPWLDSDGDGASNLDEFRAGTNPNDATSVLRQRVAKTAQGMFLYWNTQPGLIYQVESSTDLKNWAPYGQVRFAAGSEDSMLVPPGYFRIQRLR